MCCGCNICVEYRRAPARESRMRENCSHCPSLSFRYNRKNSRLIDPKVPYVSFKELLDSWRDTAAEPRTATQYAVRLPLDDAARLQALAEMFPGRTPEQIITDLLGAALQELGTAMPYVPGKKVISTDEQGDPVFEDAGPTPKFMELTRKNRKKLEAELKKSG